MTTETVIKDIVETLEDGRKGFTQSADMLAEKNHRDLAEQMREFAEQRSRFSGELRTLGMSIDTEIDENGSIAGDLHRGWMKLKEAVSGDDAHAILAAAEEGEDHAKDEYRKALDNTELPANVRSILTRQAEAVEKAHDRVRELRDTLAD